MQENAPQPGQRFKPGSISAAELRLLADSLRRQSHASAFRHAALLQLAEAAAAALEGPQAGRWQRGLPAFAWTAIPAGLSAAQPIQCT